MLPPGDGRTGSPEHGGPRQPFAFHSERPRLLLIGEEAGILPTIALAEGLRGSLISGSWKPLVLLGSDRPFPFRPRPSSIIVAGIPTGVIACMPVVEEWGIPCRLASRADLPGCYDGPVTELADAWLLSLGAAELSGVEIFYCGPAAGVSEVAGLAGCYNVPYQAAPSEDSLTDRQVAASSIRS